MNNLSQVALTRCASYDRAEIARACADALARLGGMPAFLKPGQSVLIKPNLLTDREPDRAVTTHPELVRAVIRLVVEHGGRPAVADSPSSAVRIDQVWRRTGIGAVCAEEKVPLISLEKAGSTRFDAAGGFTFSVARPALDADLVINLPKLKTHSLTTFTCAVKNTYGLLPGYQKMHLHKTHVNVMDFGRLLIAVHAAVRPALNIADAVVGMEGDGPSNGRPVRLGFIAAAHDAVALDLALCRTVGISPESVPYLRGVARELSKKDPQSGAAIVGARPEELRPKSFECPPSWAARLIPRPLAAILGPLIWVRPAVSDSCVRCGLCVRACPVEALHLPDSGGRVALDPSRCIGCCCCHEICPEHAIAMRQSPLINLVRLGRAL